MLAGLATVFVTVGLGTALSIPVTRSRPTISGAELGPTVALVGSAACIAVGIVLFRWVGEADRTFAANMAKIALLQEGCEELRIAALAPGADVNQLRQDVHVWVNQAHAWLKEELPAYSGVLRQPSSRPAVYREGQAVAVGNLAHELATYHHNLGTILFSLARERGGG